MSDHIRHPDPSRHVTVGVDYGTLSGRAVVVSVADGRELGSAVHEYAHGVVDRTLPGDDRPLPPEWALQIPQDWRDVLANAVPAALRDAGVDPADVIGIATDFTACTILPTTVDGTPLCELPEFAKRPHAYPKLWRHHAAQPHADRINAVAAQRKEPWLARYGNRISSEWQYAKGLQLLEEDPEVYERTERWIEAADWIIWELCGVETRNLCTAGYKGIYQDGRWPSADYLKALNPAFDGFVSKLDGRLAELGTKAGTLTAEAAALTGLPEGIAVAVGNVDAHVTAAAVNGVAPGEMVLVMGTSTCHVMSSPELGEVPGMCGVVKDGIVAGLYGYEAGQSGVGDIFAWWVRTAGGDHEALTAEAEAQPIGGHGLVALDWHSGNRSVLVDHDLSGVIVGLTLGTTKAEIYRALLEATAFGTRVIVESFEKSGVPVAELTVAGGLIKNKFLMQLYSDVTRRPLSVAGSAQGPALGSAIHAAVAAGAYPDVPTAAAAMGHSDKHVYTPNEDAAKAYDALYAEYVELHDHFGRGGSDALHRLRRLKESAR